MYDYQDLSVIPSYLGQRGMGVRQSSMTFGAFALMQGEVKEIIYPNSKKSLSQKYIEYRVDVQMRDGAGPAAITSFPHCLIMNHFGGVADKFHYTLRPDAKEANGQEVLATGSKVLLLCLNGETARAYIFGGIREDEEGDTQVDGHHLLWEFNGTRFLVNKDGELKLEVKGPTNVAGELADDADEAAFPTTIEISKNGNLKIYTKDENQSVLIDHENKKIEVKADSALNVEVTGGNMDIQSEGVLVGGATDNWPLFTTYRTAENTLHTTLATQLTAIGTAITTAQAALLSASTNPVWPLAMLQVGVAAGALAAVGPAFAMCASALTSFEAGKVAYESKKNKND